MPDTLKTESLQNILRDEQRLPRVPEPGIMVIFGASGDLTSRKLVPALYDLAAQRRLPLEFAVVGISRTEMSHEDFRGKLRKALEEHRPGEVSDDVWEKAAQHYDEQGLSALLIAITAINVWNRLNAATRQPAGAWKP